MLVGIVGPFGNRRVGKIRIDEIEGIEFAVGRDRGQPETIEILVDFDRQSAVLVFRNRNEVLRSDVIVPGNPSDYVGRQRRVGTENRRRRQNRRVREIREHDRAQCHAQEVGARNADAGRVENVVRQQAVNARGARAALLVDLRVISNDAHCQVVTVVVAELCAHAPTISIVDHVFLDR